MLPTADTTPSPLRRWGRVVIVLVVSVAGALGAVGCALAWLLTGFMGTAVEWWEPIAYPAGVVLSLLVPVLVGWRLLGRDRAGMRWGLAVAAATVVAGALVAVSVLGVTA